MSTHKRRAEHTASEVLCLFTQTLPLETTALSIPDVSLERVQFFPVVKYLHNLPCLASRIHRMLMPPELFVFFAPILF